MFAIRDMNQADIAFVYSSWLKSLRPSMPVLKYLFFKQQHAMIEWLLGQASTRVMIACLKDSPEVVLGWVCTQGIGSKQVVHYLYSKQDFRRMGIASSLLAAVGLRDDIQFTHYTPSVRYFGRYTPIFNPFILYKAYRDD